MATANGAFYATSAGGAATFGTLPVAQGGTGVTSNPSMLVDLGSTTADDVLKASPRPGITGTLPIDHGGTGATTAADAAANIVDGQDIEPASVTATGEVTATSGTVTHELTDKAESSAIAAVEQATATANHAVGSYFMLNGKLMRATAAIATGDAITAANATAATVQSVIDGMKSKSYAAFGPANFTPETDFSLHSGSAWRKSGNTVTIGLSINVNTTLAAGTTVTAGTITDTSLRPKMDVNEVTIAYGDANPTLVMAEIKTTGAVTFVPIGNSVPSGKYVTMRMLYVIDF